ncbi:DNA (cytosine-5-)-methyltransferase [Saccharopolyspora karakumensis]|uniref:DNA (cytosine-5-)-methyltransferase n=1 Tax=Saccharopolyspora karakumensis TaxID=2530386 RepID=A0A4V2YY63_9PSEU|nr:DNA cytosine methyltransferase [Saccharopolyspora karakumensis]TDD91997.1 DNA (cytosine-5-)-methyltransferase [Saccharopolyspora karakumensis]
MSDYGVVEICAGAGGQALGLEKAGFEHKLAIELDSNACDTLRLNREEWDVKQGDVADRDLWNPSDYRGVSLLAGGVPCPPFTIAGKQLGAEDERDLFAWAIELVDEVKPRALLLENVRGLSMPRFAGYRQHVLDRLTELGYVAEWQLLNASDFGVPQLRPRFVLVALRPEDAAYFAWPETDEEPSTVGEVLKDLMADNGWEGADEWAKRANKIAPTIVGGSKKHGGADLGPTRAKRAWAELGVDALGIRNDAPLPGEKFEVGPKLTTEMVERIQGWLPDKGFKWKFAGRKTATYRQIGNAFPPPVAAAVGSAIMRAFQHEGEPTQRQPVEHDPIYKALRSSGEFMTQAQLSQASGLDLDAPELERRISILSRDFDVEISTRKSATAYKLGEFRAFTGQEDHARNELFLKNRAKIS